MHCINCGSIRTRRRGQPNAEKNPDRYRYSCNDCGTNFYMTEVMIEPTMVVDEIEIPEEIIDEVEDTVDTAPPVVTFIRDDAYINKIKSSSRIVITTAQNNADVHQRFLETLKSYCEYKDAQLVVIPVKYKLPEKDMPEFAYDESIVPYLVDNNIHFDRHQVVIMGGLKLLATAVNPLSSLDAFSKGNTLILGHSQLQLRTLARGKDRKYPPILTTTGAVTEERYSTTKSGISADFNHSMSAVVLEFTDDEYFIRHLNFDDAIGGFCDIDECFSGQRITKVHAQAVVTGDSHVLFHDKEVYEATYGKNGLFAKVKPSYWLIHDLLDFFSGSHHTSKDQFVSYLKHVRNLDDVEAEVKQACQFLIDNTPLHCQAVVVGSNHDIHLDRWLKETDIRKDPMNAKFFHKLSYLMYKHMEETNGDIPAALDMYFKDEYPSYAGTVKFLKEFDTFKLSGIELACHGHAGQNGARGTLQLFTNMPDKTITGHSHSPAINKGSYCVGTSSIFHMGYVRSSSSWDQTHCIIHPNGKRQLIFLRNGKFRA